MLGWEINHLMGDNMYGIKDYVAPVDNARITSGEGPRASRRTLNGAKMSSFHHGVDIAGPKPGSKPPIKNITSGKVVWTGEAGGYGNTVVVRNPDGYVVQYAHLDSISVKVGDDVPAGGKIGVMGMTGNSTGVHLDLTVTKNGKTIKRDGSVLAPAPSGLMKRAGGKVPSSKVDVVGETSPTMQAKAQNPVQNNTQAFAGTTEPTTTPTQQNNTNLFSGLFGGGLNLLQGSIGLAVPETKTENNLFGGIASMGLDASLEQIYAEAARAIAGVKDSIESQPMIQSDNPLRAELSSIFDKLEV